MGTHHQIRVKQMPLWSTTETVPLSCQSGLGSGSDTDSDETAEYLVHTPCKLCASHIAPTPAIILAPRFPVLCHPCCTCPGHIAPAPLVVHRAEKRRLRQFVLNFLVQAVLIIGVCCRRSSITEKHISVSGMEAYHTPSTEA